jgi:hypothetical protein
MGCRNVYAGFYFGIYSTNIYDLSPNGQKMVQNATATSTEYLQQKAALSKNIRLAKESSKLSIQTPQVVRQPYLNSKRLSLCSLDYKREVLAAVSSTGKSMWGKPHARSPPQPAPHKLSRHHDDKKKTLERVCM